MTRPVPADVTAAHATPRDSKSASINRRRSRWLACLLASTAAAGGAGLPGEPGMAIRVRLYPEMVRVPGFPVYYAPKLKANYFFYQGWYWVFERDGWFRATWYDGPWQPVAPTLMPVFILRVPVAYYFQPPGYFSSWSRDAAPRWSERWGEDWTRRRSGWENWNRGAVRAIAPLPSYQQGYSGAGYPLPRQQRLLQNRSYPTLPGSLSTRR